MKPDFQRGPTEIQLIRPQVDCGRYRTKAIVGDEIEVTADIFRDSAVALQAVIRWRGPAETKWQEAPMILVDNDRWAGTFVPTEIGRYRYAIEAWTDRFGTWTDALTKKIDAGQDVAVELEEGARLMEAGLSRMRAADKKVIRRAIAAAREGDPLPALTAQVRGIMGHNSDRSDSTVSKTLEVSVDRERARYGAWYEFFPRSTGTRTKHGTFKTAVKELRRIAAMGFDVVYLPPIHPIGTSYRKGKNNSLDPKPQDVGSPWAIGSPDGGHKDVHPELGTLADFDAFVAEAGRLGLEVCLDYAIQCSPDHPWVTEHPDWFRHRPDGSIQYAENPPKKYQDIYPIDFDTPDREGLWTELKSIFDHWISHGVKIFRVDNPHTKSFAFWEWVINTIHDDHPEVIFLSEAFTRPKVMQTLAKLGFTQSYTYFTWRNEKWELEEYLRELTQSDMADYFRPNFFANTPDILHEYLQTGGPPAFKIRLVLAALLSPSYGIYSGYELFENVPVQEGSEEYLNSEKFELKPRDFSVKDSLVPYITRLNDIRQKHPALSRLTNLTFHSVDKDHVIAFSKTSPGDDAILAIVNLNPFHWEEATTNLDLGALGVEAGRPFEVHDLVTDTTYVWNGPQNYVRLDPSVEPAHIFRVRT
ncbi:MAG: alpha-1,4-glucan--maltose-1-phosphate maltosyltransferase [Actinomycetota bacterium]|nr:alpha-1,4-glucan--maltose-1-phosphate maltosyltransferase [Actinomycetota bacterium]